MRNAGQAKEPGRSSTVRLVPDLLSTGFQAPGICAPSMDMDGKVLAWYPDPVVAAGKTITMIRVENPTVLVADDDDSCRKSVQEALETVGFHTVPASTGLEAIEVIHRVEIHLGVFDVHMPEMTGIAALRFLRNQEIFIPIIVMTSDLSSGIQEQVIHEGAASLVLKPIDLGKIRHAVRQAFDKYV